LKGAARLERVLVRSGGTQKEHSSVGIFAGRKDPRVEELDEQQEYSTKNSALLGKKTHLIKKLS
jgi:hypothetical protein